MAKKDKDDVAQDEQNEGSIAVNDAWTGMLAISLFALLIGTGFLAWDYMSYAGENLPAVPKFTSTAPSSGPAPAPKVEPAKDGGAKN
jgi:hypothetical protein